MDGITVVRVVRQIRIVRLTGINQQGGTTPILHAQQVTAAAAVPPPPPENKRCLNAFILLILYTIGIGCIVLGSIHINDCPAQKMLPTGLVVLGGLYMVGRILNCVYDCRSICEQYKTEDPAPCIVLLNLLFLLAEFGMFIAICSWNFHINPTTNPEEHTLPNYCDHTLYYTTYYGCIVGLVLYGLPLLCCCFVLCSNSS